MDDEARGGGGDEAEARRRRPEARRALAGRQAQSPAAPARRGGLRRPRGRAPASGTSGRGLALRLGLAALAVCVVAAGAFAWLRRPGGAAPRAAQPEVIAFSTSGGNITCPQEAAWSPDGRRVALFGYSSRRCFLGEVAGGQLDIHDAATGAVVHTVALDAAVIPQVVPQSVRQNGDLLSQVAVHYSDLHWKPDGSALLLMFTAARTTGDESHPESQIYGAGALLARADGSSIQILRAPPPDPSTYDYTFSSFRPLQQIEWDLVTGKMTVARLPQALTYIRGTDGALTPAQPLPATPDAPPPPASMGAVGNPNGGASFSVWQQGYISYNKKCVKTDQGLSAPATLSPSDFYAFGLTTPAWSPDGRYFVLRVGAFGRLTARPDPAATPDPSAGGNSCGDADASQFAQMPIRDKGMANAVGMVDPYAGTQVLLAWSPDGRRLAAASNAGTGLRPDFNIYDCASGKILWQMPPRRFAPDNAPNEQLNFQSSWSPDGTRLLLLDRFTRGVFVLGLGAIGG